MSNTRAELSDTADASLSFWDDKPLLQKIVSIAPNILYVFNQKTQTNEFINSSLGASMGYSGEEIAAMGAEFMPRICHPEDLPKIQAYFQKLHLMHDGDVSQIEYRMKHKDGRWRWMLSNDAIFDRDENGAILRFIGVATDITSRKEAEERARAEKRAADAANDELQAFAYSVSHDMKAPTNTLHLLLSELLSQHDEQLDADARELVDLSIDMVHKMQDLVEDVLGYTRVIGSDAAFETVDLEPLVDNVIQKLAADIKEAGAKINVGNLPSVRANAVQMQAYLQDVIGNALKYKSQDRELIVNIADTTHRNSARASISISDNGIGISSTNHNRIFGMFKRLHLDEDIPGTGLGLALCHRVAMNHGGRVAVNSTLGIGSTFTLDLEKP